MIDFNFKNVGLTFDEEATDLLRSALTNRVISKAKSGVSDPEYIVFDDYLEDVVNAVVSVDIEDFNVMEERQIQGMEVMWSEGLDSRNKDGVELFTRIRNRVGTHIGDRPIQGFFFVVDKNETDVMIGAY